MTPDQRAQLRAVLIAAEDRYVGDPDAPQMAGAADCDEWADALLDALLAFRFRCPECEGTGKVVDEWFVEGEGKHRYPRACRLQGITGRCQGAPHQDAGDAVMSVTDPQCPHKVAIIGPGVEHILNCVLRVNHEEPLHLGHLLSTEVRWLGEDRRDFTGTFRRCINKSTVKTAGTPSGLQCVLPQDHDGNHAY